MFRFDFKIDQEATSLFDNKSSEDGPSSVSIQTTKEKAQHQEWFDAMEIVPSKEIVESLDYCELHAIDTQFGAGNNTDGTSTIRHIVSGAMLEDIKGDAKDAAAIGLSEQEYSDLLPGVYEGGAKIWECTNDLLDYLARSFNYNWQQKRVLDLGCGSGLLGIYAQKQGAIVHYQDYNRDVLEKITIPNVLMNMSSKDKEEDQQVGDRNAKESSSESEDSDDSETDEDNQLQTKKGTDNEIESESAKKEPERESPNKKHKFAKPDISSSSYDSSTLIESLAATETKFYAGDWCKYSTLTANDGRFDLILSSETIYNPENQIKLLDTFARRLKSDGSGKVLIAAKTHYFGVGGGTRQFELKTQEHGEFQTRVVWQGGHESGVKREILELSFINPLGD